MNSENREISDSALALPRLLYIGDVPVCNTVGGGSFFFRLLRNYPPDKLVVCAPFIGNGATLPGVRYFSNEARWPRLFRTRFSTLYCAWIAWRLLSTPRWLQRFARDYRPEAIVTISQTTGWIMAWTLAKRARIPWIMFAHDDYVFSRHLPSRMQPWAERLFAEAYKDAADRFCISETMEEVYERRYAVRGGVRYPIRDPESPAICRPARQTSEPRASLTFAYAGSIVGEPNLRQLADFAIESGRQGHRFVVYSPQYKAFAGYASGIGSVEARAPLDPSSLIRKLREEADCLLITGSFDPGDQEVLRTAFPSKAADYSAVGLPLLIWAPADASIARFVQKHAGIAELVTDRDPAALAPSIARLAGSPEARTRLAGAFLEVGAEMFSPESAWADFSGRLRKATSGSDAR